MGRERCLRTLPYRTFQMAHLHARFAILASLLLLLSYLPYPSAATPRHLSSLVKPNPIAIRNHRGPLLRGSITVNLVWYGNFTPIQRSIIVDFVRSLAPAASGKAPPPPAASAWWNTIAAYTGASSAVSVGDQVLNSNYNLGKSLKTRHLEALASASKLRLRSGPGGRNTISVVLTSADVAVEGFCMSRCGTHGQLGGSKKGPASTTYAWVGNAETQCPGQCAWPFHQPMYGPQAPPLVAPNGDVGIDGMVINLATVLAGTVTNPFGNGYFQGPASAPLEAVSACTGKFGFGAYPGNPGRVLVDKTTGAGYNGHGLNGRKYLIPAMWDPKTSSCKTLV